MQGQYVAGYVNGMDFSACLAAGSWAAAPAPGLVGLVTSRTDITFDNVWIRRIDAPSPAAPTWQVYDGAIAVASGQLSLTMRDGHPLALAVREGFWEDDCAIEATLTTDWQGGIAFRVQDKLNYYAVTPFMGWVFLWKVVDGQQVFVTAAWVDLDENEWSVPRQWRVKVAGSNLAVWVYSDGVWEPAAFPANVLAGGPADGGVGLATTGYEALPVLCDSFAVGYDTGSDGELDEVIYSEDFGPGWFSLTFGSESYDAAGNLLKDALYEYTYDAWNRLVKVERRAADSDDDHKALAVYRYDGLGRRIYKDVDNCGTRDSTGEYFYYDNQWRLLEVRNDADTPTRQFVWGPRYIDEAIAMYVDGDGDGVCTDFTDTGQNPAGGAERWYYMQDANWNVVRVWTDTATHESEHLKSERYEYDPYGTTRVVAGYDTSLAAERLHVMSESVAGNPIRFAGYYQDAEHGIYSARNRVYLPWLRRWGQRDPAGTPLASAIVVEARPQVGALSRPDVGSVDALYGGSPLGLDSVGACPTCVPTRLSVRCGMVTPDPRTVRFGRVPSEHKAGTNLYLYVDADPVTRVDPSGLITEYCCWQMLAKALKDPTVLAAYNRVKGKVDALWIPCLKDTTCKKSCFGHPAGRYNPITRNITMCADQLTNDQARFNQILLHEIIHAESICGWWKLGCKNCMIEEKRAYYLSGECSDDRTCTWMAWRSCTLLLACSDLLDDWQNYIGVGWPPRP